MKKSLKVVLAGILTIPLLALGLNLFAPTSQPVYAECVDEVQTLANGAACAKSPDQPSTLFGTGGIFSTIVKAVLYVLGAISVIMLVYGGIRYTTSGGAAASITAAKNTIMYAIIGLIVAILAFAIVTFVIGSIPAA